MFGQALDLGHLDLDSVVHAGEIEGGFQFDAVAEMAAGELLAGVSDPHPEPIEHAAEELYQTRSLRCHLPGRHAGLHEKPPAGESSPLKSALKFADRELHEPQTIAEASGCPVPPTGGRTCGTCFHRHARVK